MSSNKMPISLLRNDKTINYLREMFAILDASMTKIDLKALENKVALWISGTSKRLDLNEDESAMFELCSNTAYDILKAKTDLNSQERAFFDQHEFFFKN